MEYLQLAFWSDSKNLVLSPVKGFHMNYPKTVLDVIKTAHASTLRQAQGEGSCKAFLCSIVGEQIRQRHQEYLEGEKTLPFLAEGASSAKEDPL